MTKDEIHSIIPYRKHIAKGGYHIGLKNIEDQFAKQSESGIQVELNPAFQRGHVWTTQQQIAFIEALLACKLPEHTKTILFNVVYTDEKDADSEVRGKMLCIDGLQRLTACLDFMAGKFKVFDGQLAYQDFIEACFPLGSAYMLRFDIYNITSYKELLKFYIDLNSGGTVHSADEIERVKNMIET